MEKWSRQLNRRIASHRQTLVATVGVLSVWFSFNVGQSLQAAQTEHWIATTTAVSNAARFEPQSVGLIGSFLTGYSGVAIVATSIVAAMLIGYSLLTDGKRGLGWATLCIAGGILMIFVKLATALFQEVSSDNEIQDWDT